MTGPGTEPSDLAALLDGALALSRAGRLDAALETARRAAALAPESAEANALAGGILAALGRPAEALPPLERARALAPHRPDVLNNLGAALRSLERHAEALPLFARALELAPGYGDARYNLAGAYYRASRYEEAVVEYQALIAGASAPPAAVLCGLAKAQWQTNRLDDAMATFDRAIAAEPNRAETYAEYGSALAESGRLGDAATAYRRAIERAPERATYYRNLAEASPAALDADDAAKLEGMAAGQRGDADDRIDANFALSRIFAEAGDRRRSFAHLTAANAQRRAFITYDERETLTSFDRIATTFDEAFLRERRGCSDPASEPVFIVGMPRSGTSLIEQILASHPDVYGAGELELFENVTNEILTGAPLTPEAMRAASCEQLRTIGATYAHRLRALAPGSFSRITDKMPANVRFAGLISTVLPNAKIIHALRDPVETCLSCFTQYFAGDQPWAYDLAELGRYYRAYERLTNHWRAVLPPESLLEVHYEDVVNDLEGQARRMLAFCGLPWNAACLEFYKTKRPVRTASSAQVRRPIYRTSIDRATEYGDLLKPLLDALANS